ncbi:MAG: redoxin family protein, partial [Verrucomicrobiae bacterium]|nr:redoxin family protein [Verrucomicrobiae bacterium]
GKFGREYPGGYRVFATVTPPGVSSKLSNDERQAMATTTLGQDNFEATIKDHEIVLVDFWASWCGPCKASFPALNRLQKKYGPKGLVIVGVGVDDDAAKYQAFAKKMSASFPLAHDSAHKAAAKFNPQSMPSSYLIDRKGVIRYVHTGFHPKKTEKEYSTEIEALLDGK